MSAPNLVPAQDAMHRIGCSPKTLGDLIDCGKLAAWHDRVTGQWWIFACSLAEYMRQPSKTADLQADVTERAEARQADVIRLSERTWQNVRGLS